MSKAVLRSIAAGTLTDPGLGFDASAPVTGVHRLVFSAGWPVSGRARFADCAAHLSVSMMYTVTVGKLRRFSEHLLLFGVFRAAVWPSDPGLR